MAKGTRPCTCGGRTSDKQHFGNCHLNTSDWQRGAVPGSADDPFKAVVVAPGDIGLTRDRPQADRAPVNPNLPYWEPNDGPRYRRQHDPYVAGDVEDGFVTRLLIRFAEWVAGRRRNG